MALFDPWMMGQQFGGILGGQLPPSYSQKDLEELIKGYGPQWGNLPRADAPQAPIDPSGSSPMGGAPQNPYSSPNALMPAFTSTFSTDQPPPPQQQAGGPWIKPGSFLDKLINTPVSPGPSSAAAQPSFNMSGAEPSAVWAGAPAQAQTTVNMPMPPLRPSQGGPIFSGDGSQSSMGGGFGGGAFAAQPQTALPPNAQPTQGTAPAIPPQAQNAMAQAQPRQNLNPLTSVGNFFSGLDPSNRPTFGTIGHDIAGNPQYGWIDSANQKVTPLDAGAGVGYPKDASGQPLQGQELLSHLKRTDPSAASMVDAIIRGDAAVTGRNLQKYMPIATLVDPSLSQFNYDSRKKTAVDFAAGGKSANNVKSLETVGGHLDKMLDAYKALGNTWQPEYNSFKNWMSQRLGQGQVNAFDTYANGVSNELGTVFRSVGMSDAEVKSWREQISKAASPDQFEASMRSLFDMLKTRREALAEQYKTGLGKDIKPETFQKLDAAMARIETAFQRPDGAAAPNAPTIDPKTGAATYQTPKGPVVIRKIGGK